MRAAFVFYNLQHPLLHVRKLRCVFSVVLSSRIRQNISYPGHGSSAFFEQFVTALAHAREYTSGRYPQFPAQLHRAIGGDERSAPFCGFRYEHALAYSRHYAVAFGKTERKRRCARRILRDNQSFCGNLVHKVRVFGGIYRIQTARRDGYRLSSAVKRGFMRGGIYPSGKTADYRHSLFRQTFRKILRRFYSVSRRPARTYNGNAV